MKDDIELLKSQLSRIFVENLQSNNYLKNEIEHKENEKRDLLKEMSLNIIDIIDSFENIEEWIVENEYNKIDEVKRTTSRYKTIHKRLLGLLQYHGITKIEFPDKRLIVGFCEVVETETDMNRKNDEIISVIRNGYIRGKELIRPAQIIVVKN
ncbi:nucleotide exchange factor GrpE [Telluribacter sp. SYSU D00476]|uniref:nucleotide exchange factor GrpE n=1 Tax=Telluribacter sp. SYSU D00476 TaxID=2811430 RepID=UPI001FF5EFFF|nr:nucleotide exchange factor GrpE [Telluribacter sp. SYSU D00476]